MVSVERLTLQFYNRHDDYRELHPLVVGWISDRRERRTNSGFKIFDHLGLNGTSLVHKLLNEGSNFPSIFLNLFWELKYTRQIFPT